MRKAGYLVNLFLNGYSLDHIAVGYPASDLC